MHISSGRWVYGLFLALLTCFLWGILPIKLKQVLVVMDPITVTWFRLLVSGGCLFVYLAATRRLPSRQALGPKGGWLVLMAVFGLCYRVIPGLAETGLARAHFWLHQAGALTKAANPDLAAAQATAKVTATMSSRSSPARKSRQVDCQPSLRKSRFMLSAPGRHPPGPIPALTTNARHRHSRQSVCLWHARWRRRPQTAQSGGPFE